MTLTEILQQPDHSRFSIELLPPLKGQHIDSIYRTMDALMPFNPAFVDVTYHREEYVYREVGPGLLQKRTVRKRPGTVGICAALMNRYQVETVPHIICGGFSVEETENAHSLTANGKPATRIVLGDWYDQGSVLKVTENDVMLQKHNFS